MFSTTAIISALLLALPALGSPEPAASPAPTPSYGCGPSGVYYGAPTLASVNYRPAYPSNYYCGGYPNNCNYGYNNGCNPYRINEVISTQYPCNSPCPTVIDSYSAVPCNNGCNYNCYGNCNNGYGYNGGCGDCYGAGCDSCGKYYVPPVTFTTKTVATKTKTVEYDFIEPAPTVRVSVDNCNRYCNDRYPVGCADHVRCLSDCHYSS